MDINRGFSIAKRASGKKKPYMEFLRAEGYRTFFEKFREDYNPRNAEHLFEMDKMWRNLPEDRREVYKMSAREHNMDRELVKLIRDRKNRENRIFRRDHYAAYEQARQENLRALEAFKAMKQAQKTVDSGNEAQDDDAIENRRRILLQRLPNLVCPRISLPMFTEDVNAIVTENSKSHQQSIYCLLVGSPERDPLFRDDFQSQLITVLPFSHSYNDAKTQVRSYPAEICITKFNLHGVISSESIFVEFLPSWWEQQTNGDAADFDSRRRFSRRLGYHPSGPTNAIHPFEAFFWVQEKLEELQSRQIFCDFKQFNFVMFGLYTLAEFIGDNALRYFHDNILQKLAPIQNFAKDLLMTAPVSIERRAVWSLREIDSLFADKDIAPIESDLNFCRTHQNAPRFAKYMCAKAHNARLLNGFYYVLKKNSLRGFLFTQTHELCTVQCRHSELPESPIAETIFRPEPYN